MHKFKLSNKPLILGMFVLFLFFLLLVPQLPEKYSKYLTFTKGFRVKSYNISNRWNYKFHYLDGSVQGRFKAKNDNTKLIFSSQIEDVTIVFQLFDHADSLITTIPDGNAIDTLLGIFEKGEKYKIRATAKDAKGYFDFKME